MPLKMFPNTEKYNILKFNLKHAFEKIPFVFLKKNPYWQTRVNKQTIFLRKNTSDFIVFNHIFNYPQYDFEVPHAVKYIIDAGANVGLASVYFAEKYPDAKIFSIEPDESNYELMIKNTSNYKNITPIFGGINNEHGIYKIENPTDMHFGFKLKKSISPNEEGGGRFFTVEDIIKKYNIPSIDLFKIDIEGGEVNLFKDNLTWLRITKTICIELHDSDNDKACSMTFFSAMQEFDYSSHINGENIVLTISGEKAC